MEGENLTPKSETRPEAKESFDTKIKALFAGVDPAVDKWNVSQGRPTVLQDIDSFTTAEDKFTDKWWERFYRWMDGRDFHKEVNSTARITLESLDSLPPDAKLPRFLGTWISHINGFSDFEPERK